MRKMLKPAHTLLPVMILLAVTGCSRRPPEKFVTDAPGFELPSITNAGNPSRPDRISTSEKPVIHDGKWELTIERLVSMRSNTMATTVADSSTWLSFSARRIDADQTEIRILDARSKVTSVEDKPELAAEIVNSCKGLSFILKRRASGGLSVSETDDRPVPDGIRSILELVFPSVPATARQAGQEPFEWTRKSGLPDGGATSETLRSTIRVGDVRDGRTVLVHDYRGEVSGKATIENVAGTVTDSDILGRGVSWFDDAGLVESVLSDSRTWSVALTPPRGRGRLLEQKVNVRAVLKRATAGG